MPRDLRTYITVHDGMPDHPKVAGLSDRAFRLLIESWCWCAKYQTDGKMPVTIWSKYGLQKTRVELETAGLVEPAEDGFIYWHDFLEHQQSAAERAASREQKVEAGRKGGQAKALAGAKRPLEQVPQRPLEQMPSGDVAALDLELERPKDSSASPRPPALDPAFEQFWQTYPRKVGKPDAKRAWAKAIRKSPPGLIIQVAERHRADPNRQDAFTKHPATWLNAEAWHDEPIPERAPLRAVVPNYNSANPHKEW